MADLIRWSGDNTTQGGVTGTNWSSNLGDGARSGTADVIASGCTMRTVSSGSGSTSIIDEDPGGTVSARFRNDDPHEYIRNVSPAFGFSNVRLECSPMPTTQAGRVYWAPNASQGTYVPNIVRVVSTGTGSAEAFKVVCLNNSVNKVRILIAGTFMDVNYVPSTSSPGGRIEWQIDGTSVSVQLFGFDGVNDIDGTTPVQSHTGTWANTGDDMWVQLGSLGSSARFGQEFFDDIVWTDTTTAIGPYSGGAATPQDLTWTAAEPSFTFVPQGSWGLANDQSINMPSAEPVFRFVPQGTWSSSTSTQVYYGPPALMGDTGNIHLDDYHAGAPQEQRRYLLPLYPGGTPPVSNQPTVLMVSGGFFNAHNLVYIESSGDGGFADLVAACHAKGWNVIGVDYRVARGGGSPNGVYHPDQIHDIKLALKYIYDNADGLKVDVNRTAMIGHSAGGFIALWAAMEGQDFLDNVTFDSTGIDNPSAITSTKLTNYSAYLANTDDPQFLSCVGLVEAPVDMHYALSNHDFGVPGEFEKAMRRYVGANVYNINSDTVFNSWSAHVDLTDYLPANPPSQPDEIFGSQLLNGNIAATAPEIGYFGGRNYTSNPRIFTGASSNDGPSTSGHGYFLRRKCEEIGLAFHEEYLLGSTTAHGYVLNDMATQISDWIENSFNQQGVILPTAEPWFRFVPQGQWQLLTTEEQQTGLYEPEPSFTFEPTVSGSRLTAAYTPSGWLNGDKTLGDAFTHISGLKAVGMNGMFQGHWEATANGASFDGNGLLYPRPGDNVMWSYWRAVAGPRFKLYAYFSLTANRINATNIHAAIASSIQTFMAAHPEIDGILINAEPAGDSGTPGDRDGLGGDGYDDVRFNNLITEIRSAVPGIWIASTAPAAPVAGGGNNWSDAEITAFTANLDAVTPMIYDYSQDPSQTDGAAYQTWLQSVISRYETNKTSGVDLIASIPSQGVTADHDPTIENLTNAYEGLRGTSAVEGVAVYWWADWDLQTTDDTAETIAWTTVDGMWSLAIGSGVQNTAMGDVEDAYFRPVPQGSWVLSTNEPQTVVATAAEPVFRFTAPTSWSLLRQGTQELAMQPVRAFRFTPTFWPDFERGLGSDPWEYGKLLKLESPPRGDRTSSFAEKIWRRVRQYQRDDD